MQLGSRLIEASSLLYDTPLAPYMIRVAIGAIRTNGHLHGSVLRMHGIRAVLLLIQICLVTFICSSWKRLAAGLSCVYLINTTMGGRIW